MAATPQSKKPATELGWSEWIELHDQAAAEVSLARSAIRVAADAVATAGRAKRVDFDSISTQLAHQFGSSLQIADLRKEDLYLGYLGSLSGAEAAARARRETQAANALKDARKALERRLQDESDCVTTLEDAEEALAPALDKLAAIDQLRPPASQAAVADIDKELSSAESEQGRITTALQRARDTCDELDQAIAGVDIEELSVEAVLATGDAQHKAATAALAKAQKEIDGLKVDRARSDELCAGLERRAAAVDERVSELQALRRRVLEQVLMPKMEAAQRVLLDLVTAEGSPVRQAIEALNNVRAELNSATADDIDFTAATVEVTMPHLYGEQYEALSGEKFVIPSRPRLY